MVKGWVNPEEWLYPQVQEALSAWSTAHQPGHVVYRMIDLEWDRRSHDLRDALTVNGVPFAFHTKDSDSGRQLQPSRAEGVKSGLLVGSADDRMGADEMAYPRPG